MSKYVQSQEKMSSIHSIIKDTKIFSVSLKDKQKFTLLHRGKKVHSNEFQNFKTSPQQPEIA